MTIENRAVVYTFSKLNKECEFVEAELLNYIEMLKGKGLDFTYSRCDFEDFITWYDSKLALRSSVSSYKCQEIINIVFSYSIDKSHEFLPY